MYILTFWLKSVSKLYSNFVKLALYKQMLPENCGMIISSFLL